MEYISRNFAVGFTFRSISYILAEGVEPFICLNINFVCMCLTHIRLHVIGVPMEVDCHGVTATPTFLTLLH